MDFIIGFFLGAILVRIFMCKKAGLFLNNENKDDFFWDDTHSGCSYHGTAEPTEKIKLK